jgi:hypothetical protein
MRRLLIPALLAFPFLTSCEALTVGAVAGLVISQDILDNSTFVAHVNQDVESAWLSVRSTCSHATIDPIETDEDLRVLKCKYDGARVTVSVEAYDLGVSIIRVSASKFGIKSGEIADLMMRKILKDLE